MYSTAVLFATDTTDNIKLDTAAKHKNVNKL